MEYTYTVMGITFSTETFKTNVSNIWEFLVALPLDQQIALGLIVFSMFVFSLTASASYTLTKNGVEKKIEKVRTWPGWIVKGLWIWVAISVANLWWVVAIIVATIYFAIAHINTFSWLLAIAQPTITDREKRKLENSF